MAVESAGDRRAFLADFGVTVTYTRVAGGVSTVLGIFDTPTDDIYGSNAAGMIRQLPRVVVASTDVPAGAAAGDTVAVAGDSRSFRVVGIYPDGTGFSRIDLEAAG